MQNCCRCLIQETATPLGAAGQFLNTEPLLHIQTTLRPIDQGQTGNRLSKGLGIRSDWITESTSDPIADNLRC